jgi:hypothetical protein
MAKQGLDVADIVAILKQMGSETVPKSEATGSFCNASLLNAKFHGILKVLF